MSFNDDRYNRQVRDAIGVIRCYEEIIDTNGLTIELFALDELRKEKIEALILAVKNRDQRIVDLEKSLDSIKNANVFNIKEHQSTANDLTDLKREYDELYENAIMDAKKLDLAAHAIGIYLIETAYEDKYGTDND